MTASPRPMTVCQPTMAVSTVPVSIGATPPTAKSRVKTAAAAGTLTKARERGGERDDADRRLGSTARAA